MWDKQTFLINHRNFYRKLKFIFGSFSLFLLKKKASIVRSHFLSKRIKPIYLLNVFGLKTFSRRAKLGKFLLEHQPWNFEIKFSPQEQRIFCLNLENLPWKYWEKMREGRFFNRRKQNVSIFTNNERRFSILVKKKFRF